MQTKFKSLRTFVSPILISFKTARMQSVFATSAAPTVRVPEALDTWLIPSTSHADIDIPGQYILFRQDRGERKPAGGVVVYVKYIYKATLVKDLLSVPDSFFQQLWIKVHCRKLKSFMLCTVYRPPNTPINFLEDLNINFMDSLLPGLDVILLGDLNCNLLGSCSDGQALLDFCATSYLVQ